MVMDEELKPHRVEESGTLIQCHERMYKAAEKWQHEQLMKRAMRDDGAAPEAAPSKARPRRRATHTRFIVLCLLTHVVPFTPPLHTSPLHLPFTLFVHIS